MPTLLSAILACLLPCLLALAPATALAQAIGHEIEVSFDPASKHLQVTDTLILSAPSPAKLTLSLAPRATGITILAEATPIRFTRSSETIRFVVPSGSAALTLSYTLPLDPPPKDPQATLDNPGALASDATSGPDWAMLLPGSFWHPEVQDSQNSYTLRVSAPSGTKAVTQGTLLGLTDESGHSVSAWRIEHPVGRLGLCLARYQFEESKDAPAPVQTFFLAGSHQLAATYLGASAKHLRFYQELHGSYAFEKFAMVENPLPTGYGFPSYTLLGSQVLALPFIPETSLRHEVAHSWWGNGVLVDFSQGNWCEGLTTYVADYLAQEEASPQAARAYRLKTLRAFADLARAGGDMPLDRFGSRNSPASQAVGYGKALFVFHMLRGFVGNDPFWQGLRSLYADFLFKPASWEDIRRVFVGLEGARLEGFDDALSRRFFRQWLTRTGGPKLKVVRAQASPTAGGGYTVSVLVAQAGDPYVLKLSLAVETETKTESTSFILDGPEKEITLHAPDKPKRLVLDPGADCFRLLDPAEVPPSVNTVKGSRKLRVILADSAPESVRQALPGLLAGLGQERATVVRESSLAPTEIQKLSQGGLLVAGTARIDIPGYRDVLAQLPGADTVFATLPSESGFVAVFQAKPDAQTQDVASAASKVTHYGSFSLLGFEKGRNVIKDTLEAPGSPMVWEF